MILRKIIGIIAAILTFILSIYALGYISLTFNITAQSNPILRLIAIIIVFAIVGAVYSKIANPKNEKPTKINKENKYDVIEKTAEKPDFNLKDK